MSRRFICTGKTIFTDMEAVRYSYDCNAKGVILRENRLESDKKIIESIEFTYDMHGNRIFDDYEYKYTSSGKIEEITLQGRKWCYYEYDTYGRMVRETLYSNNGKIFGYRIFAYDDRGNVVSRTSYMPDEIKKELFEYEYDAHGNILTERTEEYIAKYEYKEIDITD